MRSLLGKVLAIIAVITGTVLVPASAAADKEPFITVNSASFQDGPIASGALWTIYTQDRVSPEQNWKYQPWNPAPHYGLWIEASCEKRDAFMTLPVLYVGTAYTGNQINVYKPNAIGREPWGACPYTGPTLIRIHTVFGEVLEQEVVLLPAHPGIFKAGEAPAGDHVDRDGNHTPLSQCSTELRQNPKACSVRIGGVPSELWTFLTGAEWFVCDPCANGDIRFELGPSPDAPDSAWVPQKLLRLVTSSTGVEQAMIQLLPDTNPGVYYLRVRNNFRPEYPTPLRVELGQPS
jgi:hypothetical protein